MRRKLTYGFICATAIASWEGIMAFSTARVPKVSKSFALVKTPDGTESLSNLIIVQLSP